MSWWVTYLCTVICLMMLPLLLCLLAALVSLALGKLLFRGMGSEFTVGYREKQGYLSTTLLCDLFRYTLTRDVQDTCPQRLKRACSWPQCMVDFFMGWGGSDLWATRPGLIDYSVLNWIENATCRVPQLAS